MRQSTCRNFWLNTRVIDILEASKELLWNPGRKGAIPLGGMDLTAFLMYQPPDEKQTSLGLHQHNSLQNSGVLQVCSAQSAIISESLSRTNSQTSMETLVVESPGPSRDAGNLLDKATRPSGIFPHPCQQPVLRKLRHKTLRKSSRAVDSRFKKNKGVHLFCSELENGNIEEVVNPGGFPLPLGSSIRSFISNEALYPSGSSTTSLTTEQNPRRGDRSFFQSYSGEDRNDPHSSSFKSFTSSENLFSAQSKLLHTDGSASSEVIIGSPEDFSDLNHLVESMLNDINEGESRQESEGRYLSSPIEETTISGSSLWQSIDGPPLNESNGCIRPGKVIQRNPQNVLHVEGPLDLEEAAIDRVFDCELECKRGFGELPYEISSLHELGEWERVNFTLNYGAGDFLSQYKGLEEHVTQPNCKSGFLTDTGWRLSEEPPLDDTYWVPQIVSFSDATHTPAADAQSANLPSGAKRMRQHNDSSSEVPLGCNPSSGSYNCEDEEIHEFSHSLELDAPHLSGIGDPTHTIATRFGQIAQDGSKPQLDTVPQTASQQVGIPSEADYNGIRLVHLLIACAEAVACRKMDLASVILVRLKELVSRKGSTMQRVATYFSDGLQCRIEGGRILERLGNNESTSDLLAAFRILHDISPYIKFGHFTANQAILEAVVGEKKVHIVDYEIMEGIQWPSLMQALVSRKEGPPYLRITALCRSHMKHGLGTVQETGKRLSEFAASLDLPFSFNQVRLDNEEEFRPSLLKIVKGEALVVNCMVHLPHMPHRTASSVASFLQGVRKLSPTVLTLVEEELGCNTSTFTSHFFEALYHYSAMFDSLEASLASETTARTLVEQVFFAPRITSTVTFCVSGHSDADQLEGSRRNWCSLVSSAGFKPAPLSIHSLCQARVLLSLFKDGFSIDEDSHRLLLGWRSKQLIAASVWSCK